MVNSVYQEMQGDVGRCIRQHLVNMEQKPVHGILQDCPDQIAEKETCNGFDIGAGWNR